MRPCLWATKKITPHLQQPPSDFRCLHDARNCRHRSSSSTSRRKSKNPVISEVSGFLRSLVVIKWPQMYHPASSLASSLPQNHEFDIFRSLEAFSGSFFWCVACFCRVLQCLKVITQWLPSFLLHPGHFSWTAFGKTHVCWYVSWFPAWQSWMISLYIILMLPWSFQGAWHLVESIWNHGPLGTKPLFGAAPRLTDDTVSHQSKVML